MVDGVMYVTSAWSKLFALDARTGERKWVFDPKVPGEAGVDACCDVVNRGAAAWKGRIYLGTLATAGNLVFQGNALGELAAYRATDGQKLWSASTQAGVLAAPITYELDGEQYVAIEVGWGGAFGLAGGELARDAGLP